MGEAFKFPDELDDDDLKKDDIEVSVDGDDVEIVIEDDTPPEDRNIDPLPEDQKAELETADTSDDYSARVKDKFKKYKKAWHDERRAKEAAFREQNEALRLAQQAIEENKRLKERLQSGEKELIDNYQVSAELELDKAKQRYRDAYDAGDADRLLEAQEEMFKAQIKLDRAKNFKPTVQTAENPVQIPQQRTQQPAQVDNKVAEWVAENPWFTDPSKRTMRSYAEAYHFELENTYGKSFIGTDEYYERIDEEMKRRFPEELGDKDNVEPKQTQRTKPSTVVAPAKRTTASKRVVLTKTQLNLCKKYNISPEQYAREQLKLES